MASVLVVGPHPDDQELGMGGTVALLHAQGHRVTLLDMTNGEPTPSGDPETRAKEAAQAAVELGTPGRPVPRVLLGLKNRCVEHTLEARHLVAGVMRAVAAEVVFVPYFEDAHPDHIATTRIVEDARFDAKLTKIRMPGDGGAAPVYPKWVFYYYATHLRIVPQPTFVVDVSTTLEQKLRSVACYESQFAANTKNAGMIERVRFASQYMGSRIGAAAGEGFFTREPLGLSGLGALVM
jgi:bacillithiol biosynthesis deacetylase BshB1